MWVSWKCPKSQDFLDFADVREETTSSHVTVLALSAVVRLTQIAFLFSHLSFGVGFLLIVFNSRQFSFLRSDHHRRFVNNRKSVFSFLLTFLTVILFIWIVINYPNFAVINLTCSVKIGSVLKSELHIISQQQVFLNQINKWLKNVRIILPLKSTMQWVIRRIEFSRKYSHLKVQAQHSLN